MQEIDGRLARDPNAQKQLAGLEFAEGASTLRIPVLAEELEAETKLVSRGSVRLHKGVATEERTLRVPVFHEEATIEHLPPEALGEAATSDDPDVLIIPIYEEQLVVEKRLVLKEYIRVRKRRVEEERIVRDTLRREYLEVNGPDGVVTTGPEIERPARTTDG